MAWKMSGMMGSQFSAAQRGTSYAEYSAWASNVQGNPFYSDMNRRDFFYYSMMGYDDPMDLTITNSLALTFKESSSPYDKLTISSSGGLSYGFSNYSLAQYEASMMQSILRLASYDGTLASFQGGNSNPGRIRWNPKDQTKMAYHTMKWIRYAEATNYGFFDLHAAFSSFTPNYGSGNQGFGVLGLNLVLGGRRFGFSATSALYVNTRGEFNSIVNFNDCYTGQQFTGPDGELWLYNRNGTVRGSSWGTQEYNYDFVSNYLYSYE